MIFRANHQQLLSGNKVNNMDEKEDSSLISPPQTQLSSLLEHLRTSRFRLNQKKSVSF